MITPETTLSAHAVRTDDELLRLGSGWRELFRRIGADNVFLTCEWLSQWWIHLGLKSQLYVVVVHKGADLVALAPFYISCQAGPLRLRRLGFLGDGLVGSDHMDLLVDPAYLPDAVDAVCDFLLSQRDCWD